MALTTVFPTVWTDQTYQKLEKSLVFGQPAVINTDYEADVVEFGKTVRIPSVNDPAESAYTPDGTLTYNVLTDTSQDLNIDQFRTVPYRVDDVHQRQLKGNIVEEAARRSAYTLANTADSFIAGLYAGASTANTSIGSLATGDIYDELVDLSVVMDNADIPQEGRFLVCSPGVAGAIRKNTKFITAQPDTVLNNFVGEVAGIRIFKSRNVVTNAIPAAGTTHNIAGHSSAWSFVSQLQDAESMRDPDRHGTLYRILYIYGAKVLDSARLFDVQTTA